MSAPTDPSYVANYHFDDVKLAIPNDYLLHRWPTGYQPFDRHVCTRKAPKLDHAEQASCAEPDQQTVHLLVTLPDLSPFRVLGRSDFINIVIGYNLPEFGDEYQAELADTNSNHVERTRQPDLDTKLYTAYRETWSAAYVTKVNPDFPPSLMPARIKEVQEAAAQFDFVGNASTPPRRAICYKYTFNSPIRCMARFKVQTAASPYSLDFQFSRGQLDRLPPLAAAAEAKIASFTVKDPASMAR